MGGGGGVGECFRGREEFGFAGTGIVGLDASSERSFDEVGAAELDLEREEVEDESDSDSDCGNGGGGGDFFEPRLGEKGFSALTAESEERCEARRSGAPSFSTPTSPTTPFAVASKLSSRLLNSQVSGVTHASV